MMSDQKLGKCRWCEHDGEVFKDNLLCDDCDSNVVRCQICKEEYHYENCCRHIFQDQHFEWRGAGFRPRDEDMKLPLHRLLSAMGEDFARELKGAISSGKFYTWLVAPMIGGGGSLELHGMSRNWGGALIRLGESARAEMFSDGYHWLASLYQTRTKEANQATVAWIDEWLWPFTPVPALSPLPHVRQAISDAPGAGSRAQQPPEQSPSDPPHPPGGNLCA